MKAAVVEKPGILVVKEVPDPKNNADEVLLKVLSSSICNATDNHILHGKFEGNHDFYPQILGHEVFGEVMDVGANVKGLQRGERLVLYTSRGAFCEYVTVNPEVDVYAKVPDSLPIREGPLCEMFDGAYLGAVYPARIAATDDVLIVGQGPMGLTTAAAARLTARSVATVDFHENRLRKSVEMGSDYAYDRSRLSSDEIAERVWQNTGGVDLVIMCIAEDRSKELDAFDMGVKALRDNGRMTGLKVDVKGIKENHRIDPHLLLKKNIKFRRFLEDVYQNKRIMWDAFQAIVNKVIDGTIDLGSLITHEITLTELPHALDLCENKQDEVIKVVVYPN
ncbi:MAG: zinc-dependent alcohol dehydrogenase [Bacteroidota bacterium]